MPWTWAASCCSRRGCAACSTARSPISPGYAGWGRPGPAHWRPRSNWAPATSASSCSGADRAVTARLKQALALVEVRVLDPFIVGDGAPTSMARRGWV